jgi:hypothetical protein
MLRLFACLTLAVGTQAKCYDRDPHVPGCEALDKDKCAVQLSCFWLPPITGKPFANLTGFQTGWITGAQDMLALPGGGLAVGIDNHVQLFRNEDILQGGKPYASLVVEKQAATESCKQGKGEDYPKCLVNKLLPLQNGGLAALWGGRGIALFNKSTIHAGIGEPYRILAGPAAAAAEFGKGGAFAVNHVWGDAMDPHSEVSVWDSVTGKKLRSLETSNSFDKGSAPTYCTRLSDGRVAVGHNIYDANSDFHKTTVLKGFGDGTVWNTAELTNGYIAMGGFGVSCFSEYICPNPVTVYNATAALPGGSGQPHTHLTLDMWADAMVALPDGGLAAGTRSGTINLFTGADVQAGNPPYARLQSGSRVDQLVFLTGTDRPPILAASNDGNPGWGGIQLFHIPPPPTDILASSLGSSAVTAIAV